MSLFAGGPLARRHFNKCGLVNVRPMGRPCRAASERAAPTQCEGESGRSLAAAKAASSAARASRARMVRCRARLQTDRIPVHFRPSSPLTHAQSVRWPPSSRQDGRRAPEQLRAAGRKSPAYPELPGETEGELWGPRVGRKGAELFVCVCFCLGARLCGAGRLGARVGVAWARPVCNQGASSGPGGRARGRRAAGPEGAAQAARGGRSRNRGQRNATMLGRSCLAFPSASALASTSAGAGGHVSSAPKRTHIPRRAALAACCWLLVAGRPPSAPAGRPARECIKFHSHSQHWRNQAGGARAPAPAAPQHCSQAGLPASVCGWHNNNNTATLWGGWRRGATYRRALPASC